MFIDEYMIKYRSPEYFTINDFNLNDEEKLSFYEDVSHCEYTCIDTQKFLYILNYKGEMIGIETIEKAGKYPIKY